MWRGRVESYIFFGGVLGLMCEFFFFFKSLIIYLLKYYVRGILEHISPM